MTPALLAKLHVPDGAAPDAALARATHLGIGAHADDLEILAYHGIEHCHDRADAWFGGVTVTDGAGSARAGEYQDFDDERMRAVRHTEQKKAADRGRYSFQFQLDHPSRTLKDRVTAAPVVDELETILRAARPHTLYLHNPADKHPTHVALLQHCLAALRRLPPADRPATVYGCEVWRDLDWLDDDAKIALPVGRLPDLERDLIAVFRSQVAGGKDYVTATLGRRRAHATYFQSHAVDAARAVIFALDLTPLARDDTLTLTDFVAPHLDRFRADVLRQTSAF